MILFLIKLAKINEKTFRYFHKAIVKSLYSVIIYEKPTNFTNNEKVELYGCFRKNVNDSRN